MPQHDLVIANADGATVRADLNGALGALGSSMIGPSAPTSPLAGMVWVDDSNADWVLNVYDGVDWISVGTLDPSANAFAVAGVGSVVQAYDAATAKTDTAQTFTAPQRSSLSGSANISGSVALDLSVANDFDRTLTGNVTLANPTNIVAGQKGTIILRQDATGGRTLTMGGYWKSPGGDAPALTDTANAVDRLDYHVVGSTEIHYVASYDWS